MSGAGAPQLPRTLSTLDVAAMVVAITIGAGIYSTPQLIAQHLPSLQAILACWIAAGLLAWLGGLVYAEAGTRMPVTGGEYAYLVRAYGSWVGHLFGWVDFFLTAPSARVGLALVAADYATRGLPAAARTGFAAALIVVLCAVNYLGARLSIAVQKALVAAKVGGLGVLIACCLLAPRAAADPAPASPGAVGLEQLAAALLLVFFSYHGWARIGDVAGEIRDPRRSLPFGLLAGLALVAALYLGTVLGMHRVLGMEGVRRSTAVAADAATAALGSVGGALVAVLVVVSTASSMTASIMASTRIYFAMGRDGYLFRWFHFVDPRFATPSRAILAHGAVCLAFLALRQSVELHLTAFVFGRLLFIGLTGASLFVLRRREGRREEVFEVPFYPVLPALFVAGIGLLIAGRLIFQWRETLVDLLVLACGLPLLAVERWLRGRSRRTEHD